MLCPLLMLAQSYKYTGSHYEVPGASGVDHVVIFANVTDPDASIEYTGRDTASWTDFQGNVVQKGIGAETLYPEANHGYMLYEGDSLLASFFVIDYAACRPNLADATLTAELDCKASTLTLDNAEIPALTYQTTAGKTVTIKREGTITYTSLHWGDSSWEDSTAVETVTLRQGTVGVPFSQTISVGAPYRSTSFCLRLDDFVSAFNELPDSIYSEDYDAIAVCSHSVSVTTSRDYNGLGIENEPQRPIDESTLTGSAPLEINFIANGNKPVALYYKWQIFKGSDLIAERFDEEQRYTFMDNGSYQVKGWVYNDYCTTDSTVFDITVSESMLLVPNVFTPNGDGMNDEFRVVYRSLEEFHCWVYNRWGKLVYKWDDPAKGWDGTINGLPASEGAYYYIIRARGTDADASVKYHKATKRNPADVGVYQLSGSINLLRGKQ